MEYNKLFDPNKSAPNELTTNIENFGDRTSKSVYVYEENIILAVNVAIATSRPLLVRGPSGWGKSSLAKNVAKILGCKYYEKVISSRIQARDLLWEVDMISRLQDAQMNQLEDISYYIRPGVLWKVFDLNGALAQESKALSLFSRRSGTSKEQGCGNNTPQDIVQEKFDSSADIGSSKKKDTDIEAVVLLDEIDKADVDFPNNLLVPLGSLYFMVDETGTEVKCEKPPLVIITTNDERDLPPAFLRRCVELQLSKPDLLEVGKAHFGQEQMDLVKKVANLLDAIETNQSMEQFNIQFSEPSPAEFIDAVNACINLRIENPDSIIWNMIKKITVLKHGREERGNFDQL